MLISLPQRILNYQLDRLIHESDRTLVYRGTTTDEGKPIVIKLMRNQYPSFQELVQFRNQYAIAKNLNISGIVKPYGLERYENRYALIMEDFGGTALSVTSHQSPVTSSSVISHQSPVTSYSIAEFLNIAIQLADILHQLHQNRVIHKDIKPANILIHPETRQVRIIDFSISSLLPKETQIIQPPDVLEGTLAYLSPEQTGRMNRGIDYRSDFYSLGVTFYELLTGKLPFASEDPLELIHAHIAKSPPSISHQLISHQSPVTRQCLSRNLSPALRSTAPKGHQLGIGGEMPEVLSDIVLKLMAKNAEDRYQSALGLKYDLEKCLSQWQEMGKIEPFALGERDICDRFLIPEKLYGRDKEVQMLLDAFERVTSPPAPQSPPAPLGKGGEGGEGGVEMVLVAGYSGVGKTAVVNEVHKPIVAKRGYFCQGKYDQFNRNVPFSGFVQALRDLMGQLLGESDAQLQRWKNKILAALGDNGRIIIEVIPELERIIGQQPPVPKLEGSAAQHRFNLLFEKFVGAIATREHPLALFIDDLQWADSASLNLLKVLMDESADSYLLVLGAYRDNEVFPAHPLMLTRDELQKRGANLRVLTLAPLDEMQINRLVADTLLCSTERAAPLSRLVYQKTRGNPFFTTQFLQGLHEEGWIVFIPPSPLNPPLVRGEVRGDGGWQCDLTRVRQSALTDDVVEFMVERLRKLPPETQKVLKLAACIGNSFDLETLAVVRHQRQEDVATNLWSSLQEGFVLPNNETYKFFQGSEGEEREVESAIASFRSSFHSHSVRYRFLHDRIQQAAYSLIPEDQKQLTHLKVGRRLLKHNPRCEQSDRLFSIVNHLNLGREFMPTAEEKEQLARLNLSAGQKAREATAYRAAFDYLSVGVALLPQQKWTQQYELALLFHREGVMAACGMGEFETMNQWATIAIDNARTLLDRVPFSETQIQALVAQKHLSAAIHLGIETLKELGESFSQTPQPEDFPRGIAAIASSLAGRSVEDLIDLPPMEDPQVLAILRVLWRLSSVLVMAAPQLMPFCTFKAVQLSLASGNSVLSAPAYVTYGMILCGALGDIATGYRFGKLALEVVDKYAGKAVRGKTLIRFNAGVRHWQDPLQDTLDSVAEGYQLALEVGDLESAAICAEVYGYHAYFSGRELQQLEREMAVYSQGIQSIQQQTMFYWNETYRQLVLNLLDRSDDPCCLVGTAYDETLHLPMQKQYNDGFGVAMAYLFKAIACYLFDRFDRALENLNAIENYLQSIAPFAATPVFYFYTALAHFATISMSAFHREADIPERVRQCQEKLQHWANHAPANYRHKLALIEAERFRILGRYYEAGDRYDCAIVAARENEYVQEEALANELAAKFYLDWGKEKVAAGYMQEAYYAYARWGAKAKTDRLEQCYPHLLAPISSQSESELMAATTLTSVSTKTLANTSQNAGELLDFASLMKASRTLSREIERDRAIANLMQVLRENAGAQTAALMLFREETLMLEAKVADEEGEAIEAVPVAESHAIPLAIVNTVKRAQKTLVLDDAGREPAYAKDAYLQKHQPRSILCLPLQDSGRTIGILYLENNQTAGVFTGDRVEILSLLCAQAAITLENARLYQQAQQALKLEQEIHELQRTQLHLIQSEKMFGLGQMVAGIAHEINNPVNFIHGNIAHADEYTQNLIHLLELYRHHYPQPHPEIREEIEAMDLAFLEGDLSKLFQSMRGGSDRIQNIVSSLRTFARLDEAEYKAVDLHAGLDSALTILQNRLQAGEEREEIQVIKDYDNLPRVECYAGQLNQVFMNILGNAIDALNSSSEIQPQIGIRTRSDSEKVTIAIADNGAGMSEEIISRIFDPFFTTKPVGQGTGLGLSISYQIVTEKHRGSLTCTSQPGETVFIIKIPIRQ
ncbi:MAG: AAA family ATPase [Spirulina sp.]